MAKKFIPNTSASGVGTPFDNIVGLQTVQGGGLTQGNFEFSTLFSEKVNRTFNIGVFQDPINLENLDIESVNEARLLLAKEYRVFPNYDLSQVTNFTIYGSLQKRLEVSVQRILNFFPAGLDIDVIYYDYSTGNTATNISYDSLSNETELTIDVSRIKNPFSIEYSTNSVVNLQNREQEFSPIRDLTNRYRDYALVVNGLSYPIIDFTPSNSLFTGTISLVVTGKPFVGGSTTLDSLLIKPNDYYTEKSFSEDFDEVEKFLLNRLALPIYTATFSVPVENDNGVITVSSRSVTWTKDGVWNLDIRTQAFGDYLEQLNTIGVEFDVFKTNLVARFLVTESLLEFDTPDHKVGKVLTK